jgi:hypothetical protein
MTFDHKFTLVGPENNPYRDFNEFINGLVYQYLGLNYLATSFVGMGVENYLYKRLGEEGGYYMSC